MNVEIDPYVLQDFISAVSPVEYPEPQIDPHAPQSPGPCVFFKYPGLVASVPSPKRRGRPRKHDPGTGPDRKEYFHQYHLTHKAKELEYARQRRREKGVKDRSEYIRQYRINNAERIKQKCHEYAEAHKAERAAYRIQHREHRNALARASYQRKKEQKALQDLQALLS